MASLFDMFQYQYEAAKRAYQCSSTASPDELQRALLGVAQPAHELGKFLEVHALYLNAQDIAGKPGSVHPLMHQVAGDSYALVGDFELSWAAYGHAEEAYKAMQSSTEQVPSSSLSTVMVVLKQAFKFALTIHCALYDC